MYRCSEERVNYVTGIGGLMVPETPRWLDSVKMHLPVMTCTMISGPVYVFGVP